MTTQLPQVTQATAPALPSSDAICKALMVGDLKQLNPAQKLDYYKAICDSVGLNPLTQPFQYMTLSGKEVLYAGKACAEQLRKIHSVSIPNIEHKSVGDLIIVTATAQLPNGRTDTSTAAVSLKGLGGEQLANAIMKCETKAKRRATLSIVGLGMLDESEVSDNPQLFTPVPLEQAHSANAVTSASNITIQEGAVIDLGTGEVVGSATASYGSEAPQHAEPAGYTYIYSFPFTKDKDVFAERNALAKQGGCRFYGKKDGHDNTWRGPNRIEALEAFLTNPPPAGAFAGPTFSEDELPPSWEGHIDLSDDDMPNM